MMELKEPKRKRRVPPILQQPFPIPIGGISAISADHWPIYNGSYLEDCVVVEDPNDMAALYSQGFFGNSSLSRDGPSFQKGAAKTPVFIRQRQWERRCTWAKKQQEVMVSDLQGNRQDILEQVSRTPSKDQFCNSLKELGKEDVNMCEKTVAENGTVAIEEIDEHNEGTEHITTNTLADKPGKETELVLESDQIKEATKSVEGDYDVILLDSEEDEIISVVDETRSSRKIRTSENQNIAPASNVSQSKLTFGKEVNVVSEDSQDGSIIVNDSGEKTEIIRVEENGKVLDPVDNDRSDLKRERRVMDDDIVPQEKRRRVSDKDEAEIDANLNKPEIAGQKSHASREHEEVILIDMEECSKEGVEGEIVQNQTEMESNGHADERNKEDASVEVSQPTGDATEKSESENDKKIQLDSGATKNSENENDKKTELDSGATKNSENENDKKTELDSGATKTSENENDKKTELDSDTTKSLESENDKKTELDRSQDSLTEIKVPLPHKNTEETAVGDGTAKSECVPEPSAKGEDSNSIEMNKVTCIAEPDASSSANITTTEKQEENISDSEKTKSICNSVDATVHTDTESSDNITEDADEHKTKAHFDISKIGSSNGDDEDLVLVLSDGDSDSEEFVKHLNPRLEKDIFPVRNTLQLMLEEAFFLSFGLGCLQVVDMCGKILSLTQMWQVFRKADTNFTFRYIAYHYFRSKCWVVKPGIKFGGDFLLYKQGPPYYHASYIVIVKIADRTSRNEDDQDLESLSCTRISGLVRLAESAGKEILLCHVIKPPDVTQESMDSPSIISKFQVQEELIRRWVPSEEREDGDFSD